MMENHGEGAAPGGDSVKAGRKALRGRNWADYLWIIWDHWIVALVVSVSITAGFIFLQTRKVPLYRSSAIVIFEVQQDMVINIEQVVDTSMARATDLILRNHLTDLRSNTFRARVVDSFSPDEVQLIIRDYKDPKTGNEADIHGVIIGANQIKQFGGNVFNFEFHHRNPQAAALLANRYVEEYNDFLLERARKANDAALRFLRSQTEELKLKVERAELAVQRYRQERNLVSLEESQNLIVGRMKDLSSNLNAAKVELINLSSRIQQIEAAQGNLDELARIPAVNQMGTLPSKFESRTSLMAERKALSIRYGRKHPKMIANESALESIEADIRATVEKNVSDLLLQEQETKARVDNLQTALAAAEKESLDLDQVAIEYNILRRKLETDTRLFTQVSQRLNEAILASQLNDTNLRIVDTAWPAPLPFTPDMKKVYSLAALMFLVLFGGVPFAIHYLNLNLKSVSDMEDQLGIPFLGEVRKFPKRIKHLHRLVLDQSDPQAAELFRQIHSEILLKNKKLEPGHTFVVTSALPKEGKSFFAINLAASFSRHHYRTLLVDCDFRRPSIASRLRNELAELVSPDHPEDQPVEVAKNFHVLPVNKTTVEATEQIESQAFQAMLGDLQKRYDIIIIDTPPAGLFPDAGLLGSYAHNFIFVTQLNKHRKAFLLGLLCRLEQSKAKILGAVVNRVTRSSSRHLGSYRYADYRKYKNYYPGKAAKTEAAAPDKPAPTQQP